MTYAELYTDLFTQWGCPCKVYLRFSGGSTTGVWFHSPCSLRCRCAGCIRAARTCMPAHWIESIKATGCAVRVNDRCHVRLFAMLASVALNSNCLLPCCLQRTVNLASVSSSLLFTMVCWQRCPTFLWSGSRHWAYAVAALTNSGLCRACLVKVITFSCNDKYLWERFCARLKSMGNANRSSCTVLCECVCLLALP